MPANAQFTIPASSALLNRVLYFYKGQSAKIETTTIKQQQGVQLISEAEVTIYSADNTYEFLLLQGRPIGEPVVQYGPFVMNTDQEIQQAFADYQQDQFGGWPWPTNDPVHLGRTRFAKHADGTLEKPKA